MPVKSQYYNIAADVIPCLKLTDFILRAGTEGSESETWDGEEVHPAVDFSVTVIVFLLLIYNLEISKPFSPVCRYAYAESL